MSVEVTRLPSGLTVVTDSMPHLETASLGVWVGVRQPRRAAGRARHLASARAHGVQGHHAPHARARSPRRSRRSAATSMPRPASRPPPITRGVLKADVPLALDVLSDILANPTFDPARAQARAARHRAGDRRERGHARRPRVRPSAATAFPEQPIGRSILGTPETVCSFETEPARLSRAQLSRARHGGRRGRRGRPRRRGGRGRRGASPASPDRPRRAAEAGELRRRRQLEARELEQVHLTLALEGLPQRDPELFSLQVFTIVLGGGMSSRLFQEVREKRGLCYSIYSFHAPYADTGMFGVYAGTDADASELMRVVVDQTAARREHITEVEVARAKAQMKVGLLMALESSGARAEPARQPDPHLWPAAAARGNRRQDRSRHGRKRACRRRAR